MQSTLENLMPRVGDRIERYELLEELGRGGFGVVFRARQVGLGAEVAVKVLLPQLLDDARAEEVQARFEQEARLAQELEHPCAIKVRDFGKTEVGWPFLVTELVRGRGLERVLAEGPLSEARTAHIADQILGCLGEAHDRGIVHRDLKPSNIMLRDIWGEQDVVKVLDFGVAKVSAELGGVRTQTGHGMGTPHYMAPEQARGARDLDGRADLYALGLVMAECLAGERVVLEQAPMAAIYEHARPEPHQFHPAVQASALFALIRRASAKDPAERFAGAAQMRQELRATPVGQALVTARTSPPSQPLATPSNGPLLHTPAPAARTSGSPSERTAPTGMARVRRSLVVAVVVLAAVVGVLLLTARPDPAMTADVAPPRSATAAEAEEAAEAVPSAAAEVAAARSAADLRSQARGAVYAALPEVGEATVGGQRGVAIGLGGQRLCETPCVLAVPRVDARVTLSLSRRGYRNQRVEVDLRQLDQLDIRLERARQREPREPEPAISDNPFGRIERPSD